MAWKLLYTLRLSLLTILVSFPILLFPWMSKKRRNQRWRRASLVGFHCSGCDKLLLVDDQLAGRKGQCKDCGTILLIPQKLPRVPVLPEGLKPALVEATESIRTVISLDGPHMNTLLRTFILVIGMSMASAGLVFLTYQAYWFFVNAQLDNPT